MLWQNAYPIINDGKNSVWQFGNTRYSKDLDDLKKFLDENNTRGEFEHIYILEEAIFCVDFQNQLKFLKEHGLAFGRKAYPIINDGKNSVWQFDVESGNNDCYYVPKEGVYFRSELVVEDGIFWQNVYPIINDGKNSVWQLGNTRYAQNATCLECFLKENSQRGEFKYVYIPKRGILSVGDRGQLKLIAN